MPRDLPSYSGPIPADLEALLEEHLAHTRREYERVEPLVHNRAVAKALAKGYSPAQIAKALGVPESAVRRAMEEVDMADMLKAESRRIIRHLSERNLGEEKYLALAEAAGKFIINERLLRNEPTEIRWDERRLVERLEVAFSVADVRGRPPELPPVERASLDAARDESAGSEPVPPDDDYSNI